MAELLPYAKRETRVRPGPPPTPYHMFDQINFHKPLNKQQSETHYSQEGHFRQVEMKASVRAIDGRLDEVERNRMNMFNEANVVRERTIKQPTSPNRPTRHGMTPYSYSTLWINHPPENTSLSPLKSEAYLTSFLATPNSVMDKSNRAKSSMSKYESIRFNDEKFHSFIEDVDKTIQARHQRNMDDIRLQRGKYQEALEARQRLEKIHYF
ncbi:hypothetical protein TRFO_17739 [Tritrichomonas foetus]|uniref:Uncharacterized protein n=1 Tax=Tritrichomonas foetus TaxID=1144522 RepID=A0A1J4KMW9_9EUKA|nr:hypothetical protein TRFO_17739 [Tritrichomonas foetus]|eukprot:OHT12458.1 hypothetical protein TRFO_17739 [Tritrichomonas foetus]